MLYRGRRRSVLPRTEIGCIASGRRATAPRLFGDAKVDNVDHARHLILDILWEGRRQGLAGKLQIAKIHGERKFGEVKLAGSGRVGESPAVT